MHMKSAKLFFEHKILQRKKGNEKQDVSKDESSKCPAIVAAMMKHCLESHQSDRPSFSDISENLRFLHAHAHAQESKVLTDQQRNIHYTRCDERPSDAIGWSFL